jgi:hypothetical protein
MKMALAKKSAATTKTMLPQMIKARCPLWDEDTGMNRPLLSASSELNLSGVSQVGEVITRTTEAG